MNWAAYRALFPALDEWAYFGWASVAPLSTRAAEAMSAQIAATRDEGVRRYRDWYRCYEETRAEAAKLIGAAPAEIALLKNTGEGVSTVAFGLPWKPGDNVVLPRGEFPANREPWRALRERGVEVRHVEVDAAGRYSPEDIARRMDGRTRALAVSFVNYALGFRADLAALGEACRARGVFFFVDAIQGLGALPLDVAAMKIDGLAADGHKWLAGPEGQALLYVRAAWLERLAPLSRGWWSLEVPGRYGAQDQALCKTARRFECGTLNTCGTHGLRAALALVNEVGVAAIARRIARLTERLVERLDALGYPTLRADRKEERSGIVAFETPGREARQVAADLERSRVLVNAREGRVRAAVHAWNNAEDIERLLAALPRP